MTRESLDSIKQNFYVGDVKKNGPAWWGGMAEFSHHYDEAIPVADILNNQINWSVAEADVHYTARIGNYDKALTDARAELGPNKTIAELKAMVRDLCIIDSDQELPAKITKTALMEMVAEFQAKRAAGERPMTYEGKKIYYRDDTGAALGLHSDGHAGHSYKEWLLDTVSTVLGGDLHISSSILMRGGSRMAIQFSLGENVEFLPGEIIRPYLSAWTSFDGSLATGYGCRVTRVVCDNTFDTSLGEKGQTIKVKHTKHSQLKIKDARQALGLLEQGAEEYIEQAKKLIDVKVTDQQFAKFLELHVPMDDDAKGRGVTMATKKRETLTGLWNTDPRTAMWKNTVYGILQIVNTFNQHETIVRAGKGGAVTRAERREENVLTGKLGDADRDAMKQLQLVMA